MNLYKKLREQRLLLGLTQQKLAERAEISIATLQNIEAEKANLSLETLNKILAALNLKLDIQSPPVDWDRLCDYGLGLLSEDKKTKPANLNKKELAELLISASLEIKSLKFDGELERKKVALESLLLAIQNHYPTFFKKLKKSSLIKELLIKEISSKHIKLYRYSKNILGTFL